MARCHENTLQRPSNGLPGQVELLVPGSDKSRTCSSDGCHSSGFSTLSPSSDIHWWANWSPFLMSGWSAVSGWCRSWAVSAAKNTLAIGIPGVPRPGSSSGCTTPILCRASPVRWWSRASTLMPSGNATTIAFEKRIPRSSSTLRAPLAGSPARVIQVLRRPLRVPSSVATCGTIRRRRLLCGRRSNHFGCQALVETNQGTLEKWAASHSIRASETTPLCMSLMTTAANGSRLFSRKSSDSRSDPFSVPRLGIQTFSLAGPSVPCCSACGT